MISRTSPVIAAQSHQKQGVSHSDTFFIQAYFKELLKTGTSEVLGNLVADSDRKAEDQLSSAETWKFSKNWMRVLVRHSNGRRRQRQQEQHSKGSFASRNTSKRVFAESAGRAKRNQACTQRENFCKRCATVESLLLRTWTRD